MFSERSLSAESVAVSDEVSRLPMIAGTVRATRKHSVSISTKKTEIAD